jgi:hypothetical protein
MRPKFLVLLTLSAVILLPSAGIAAVGFTPAHHPLRARDLQVWNSEVHASNFSPLARAIPRGNCEASRPPEALATPDPLLDATGEPARITVSFIVGTDGRVHSPLILQGLGPSEDRVVLGVVSSWRYRPATCNGVPTEAEAKIAFSSR